MINIECGVQADRFREIFGAVSETDEWNEQLGIEYAVAEEIADRVCTIGADPIYVGYEGMASRKISEPFTYISSTGTPVVMRLGLMTQTSYVRDNVTYKKPLKTVQVLLQSEDSEDTFIETGSINYFKVNSDANSLDPKTDLDIVMGCVILADQQIKTPKPKQPQPQPVNPVLRDVFTNIG